MVRSLFVEWIILGKVCGCSVERDVDPEIDVLDYDLSTRLDPETLHMQSAVRLRVPHTGHADTLRLEFEGMRVTGVTADSAETAFKRRNG